jgi:hypothetical protein
VAGVYSHARELTCVANPSSGHECIEAARRIVREVEQLVSGQRPGSLPEEFPNSDLNHHALRRALW